MNINNAYMRSLSASGSFIRYPFSFVFVSLTAIVATFLVTNSALDLNLKLWGFAAIVAVFIASSLLYLWHMPRVVSGVLASDQMDLERCLRSLDEAKEYFSGSLTTIDVFRLVSSRVAGILPLETSELYLLDETRSKLRIAASGGEASADRTGRAADLGNVTADRCFASKSLEIGAAGREVAIPLQHGVDVFGVLLLTLKVPALRDDGFIFESIGQRIAPLILNSIAFERSQASALTDITTDLPNERAFYLILENQIAEAQRKLDARPLTILSFDIKNFAGINDRFGHTAGDRALNAAAKIIKDNLRQMDFFARAVNDEFLAILPTASKAISYEIIARVCNEFSGRKLMVTDDDAVEIELNIGWAAFGEDGDTPEQLLRTARVRKAQKKSTSENKVLWFMRESAADITDLASQPF